MRLRLNLDEVPGFLELLKEQLDSSTGHLTLALELPRKDAERTLATANPNAEIELVWGHAFRRL
jgi:hypothetical protein